MSSRGSPRINLGTISYRIKRNKIRIMERSPKVSARQRGRRDVIVNKINIGRRFGGTIGGQQRVVINKINIGRKSSAVESLRTDNTLGV